MLNGNPAVDIFDGMKLAAGGELGIGVGEEDWGSGEREVLEGFVGRTEGLIDLIVSRFGEPATEPVKSSKSSKNTSRRSNARFDNRQWLGNGAAPGPSDGVIFSGVGAIKRTSLRDVSEWMQWLYAYGEDAYGVQENPTSAHRRKRRRLQPQETKDPGTPNDEDGAVALQDSAQGSSRHRQRDWNADDGQHEEMPVGIPPPIVPAAELRSSKAATSATADRHRSRTRERIENKSSVDPSDSTSSTDTLMKYLTLGVYGSSWGLPSARPSVQRHDSSNSQGTTRVDPGASPEVAAMKHIDPKAEPPIDADGGSEKMANTNCRFIIGLTGNLDESEIGEDDVEIADSGTDHEVGARDSNSRILIRALHAGLAKPDIVDRAPDDHDPGKWVRYDCDNGRLIRGRLANVGQPIPPSSDRLRVVVYVVGSECLYIS